MNCTLSNHGQRAASETFRAGSASNTSYTVFPVGSDPMVAPSAVVRGDQRVSDVPLKEPDAPTVTDATSEVSPERLNEVINAFPMATSSSSSAELGEASPLTAPARVASTRTLKKIPVGRPSSSASKVFVPAAAGNGTVNVEALFTPSPSGRLPFALL